MVATVTGEGLGLFNSQQSDVPGKNQVGQANLGVYVNAVNGNLVVQREDQILVNRGLDAALIRTYNSQGQLSGQNNGFRFNFQQTLSYVPDASRINKPDTTVVFVTADGHEVVFKYDQVLKFYVSTEGEGAHDTLEYLYNEWIWTEGSSKRQEIFSYIAGQYRLTAEIDNEKRANVYEYNTKGQLILIRDSATISFHNGIKDIQLDNESQRMFLSYDSQGLLKEVHTYSPVVNHLESQIQIKLHYRYDNQGRLIQVITDLSPQDLSISDGNIYQTSYTYVADSKLIASIVQSDGSTIAFAYDNQQRITKVIHGAGNDSQITRYEYNDSMRQTSIIQDAGAHKSYRSTIVYDEHGRLHQTISPPTVDGESIVKTFLYDEDDNITSIKDGRQNESIFTYDDNGNLIKEVNEVGNITYRNYDEHNNLLKETTVIEGGNDLVSHYIYDNKHRLRFLIAADGKVQETLYKNTNSQSGTITSYQYTHDTYTGAGYTFNALVAWASTKNNVRMTRTHLDFRGQVSQVDSYEQVGKDPALPHSTSTFVYDQQGQLLEIINPKPNSTDGYQTHFIFDGLGRLVTSINANGDRSVTQYDNKNQRIIVTAANQLQTTSVYNSAGELLTTSQIDLNNVQSGAHTTRNYYDAVGRLVIVDEGVGVNTFYIYDELNRLLATIDSERNYTANEYDENNNLVKTIAYGTQVSGAISSSIILNHQDKAIHMYQPIVDVSVDRVEHFIYDAANRLRFTVDADGYVSESVYDQSGRLINTIQHAEKIENIHSKLAQFVQSQESILTPQTPIQLFNPLDKVINDAISFDAQQINLGTWMKLDNYDFIKHGTSIIQSPQVVGAEFTVTDSFATWPINVKPLDANAVWLLVRQQGSDGPFISVPVLEQSTQYRADFSTLSEANYEYRILFTDHQAQTLAMAEGSLTIAAGQSKTVNIGFTSVQKLAHIESTDTAVFSGNGWQLETSAQGATGIQSNNNEGNINQGSAGPAGSAGNPLSDIGATYLATTGEGVNKTRWFHEVKAGLDYEVYARWTAGADRATNAPYTVYHLDEWGQPAFTTVTVNQQNNDREWVLLGTFRFADGQTKVLLSDHANGVVAANAVRFKPLSEEDIIKPVLLDNQDANFIGERWSNLQTDLSGFIGDGYQVAPRAYGNHRVEWQTEVNETKKYEVFVRGFSSEGKNSNSVNGKKKNSFFKYHHSYKQRNAHWQKYYVYHRNGEGQQSVTPVWVDMRRSDKNGEWISLGTFHFGNDAKVVLKSQFNGNVVADAIRFDPKDNADLVLDNKDAVFAGDKWQDNSSSKRMRGYMGDDYRIAKSGAGDSTAIWQQKLDNKKEYSVYMRAPAHHSRTSAAPVSIQYTDKKGNIRTDNVTVNMRGYRTSNEWIYLGTYHFASGFAQVTLSNTVDGTVAADGIKFEPLNIAELLLDDRDAKLHGHWEGDDDYDWYDDERDYPIAPADMSPHDDDWEMDDDDDEYQQKTPASADWTVKVSGLSTYKVYARWDADEDHASNAPFTIRHLDENGNGVVSTVLVNMRDESSDGVWVLLGEYRFAAGETTVTLSNTDTDGEIVAGELKFDPQTPVDASDKTIDDQQAVISGDDWDDDNYRGVRGYYGKGYRVSESGDGSSTASWTHETEAASYTVYARWTSYKTRASNAPFTVYHLDDLGNQVTSTVRVNMKDRSLNGEWFELGTFRFGMDGAKVVLSNDANGTVAADAVRFDLVNDARGLSATDDVAKYVGDWLIKNNQIDGLQQGPLNPNRAVNPELAKLQGPAGPTVIASSARAAGAAGNSAATYNSYRIAQAGSGEAKVEWNLPVSAGISYNVYARWVSQPGSATDAPYAIHHVAGTTTVVVDQQQYNEQWYLLGTYRFTDKTAKITLSNQTNGSVVADDIRLIPVSQLSSVAQITYVDTIHKVNSKVSMVDFIPRELFNVLDYVEATVYDSSGKNKISQATTHPRLSYAQDKTYNGTINLTENGGLSDGHYSVEVKLFYLDDRLPTTQTVDYTIDKQQGKRHQSFQWDSAVYAYTSTDNITFSYRLANTQQNFQQLNVNKENINGKLQLTLNDDMLNARYEYLIQYHNQYGRLLAESTGIFTGMPQAGSEQRNTISIAMNMVKTVSHHANNGEGTLLEGYLNFSDPSLANYVNVNTLSHVSVKVRDVVTGLLVNMEPNNANAEAVKTFIDPGDVINQRVPTHINLSTGIPLSDGDYKVEVTLHFINGDETVREPFVHQVGKQAVTAAWRAVTDTGGDNYERISNLLFTDGNDRQNKLFYNDEGQLQASLDAENYLTRYIYNTLGEQVQLIRYGKKQTQLNIVNHQIDLNTIIETPVETRNTDTGVLEKDQSVIFVYNSKGQLEVGINELGAVLRNQYDAVGNLIRVTQYANLLTDSVITTMINEAGGMGKLSWTDHVSKKLVFSNDDRTTVREYDGLNQLILETDHTGTQTKQVYNKAGQVIESTLAYGTDKARKTYFEYDAFGRLVGEISALALQQVSGNIKVAQKVRHEYDSAGRRLRSYDVNNHRTLYFYDYNNRLRFSVNHLGEMAELQYNSFGEVTASVAFARRPNGMSFFNYYQGGLLRRTILNYFNYYRSSNDVITEMSYNRRGLVVADRNGVDSARNIDSRQIEYNAFGEQQTVKEFTGNPFNNYRKIKETNIFYDKRGLNISETIEGIQTQSRYDGFGRLIAAIDAKGNRSQIDYSEDNQGRLLEINTDADGNISKRVIDVFGRTIQEENRLGLVTKTEYSFDAAKNQHVIITKHRLNGQEIKTTSRVDVLGQQISMEDANGSLTKFIYDVNGNLTERINANGNKQLSSYDVANQLLYTIDEQGLVTEFEYDAVNRLVNQYIDRSEFKNGRLITKSSGLAIRTEYFYNPLGQQYEIKEYNYHENGRENHRVTEMTFDKNGEVIRTMVGGLLYTYYVKDSSGNSIRVDEGNNKKTFYEFDDLGRRISEETAGMKTTFVYDANNNMVLKTNAAGGRTAFIYDNLNRPVYEIAELETGVASISKTEYSAESQIVKTVVYAHEFAIDSWPLSQADVDKLTLLHQQIGADQSTFSFYDELSRQTHKVDAMGYVSEMKYDANGNTLITKKYSKAIDLNRLVTGDSNSVKNQISTSAEHRASYQIFDAMNRMRFSIDGEGYVTETLYNRRGQVLKTINWQQAVQLTEYVEAQISALQKGRAVETESTYDAVGRLIGTRNSEYHSESYTLNQLGKQLVMRNAKGAEWHYEYNRAGLLTKEISPEVNVAQQDSATMTAKISGTARNANLQWRPPESASNVRFFIEDKTGQNEYYTTPIGLTQWQDHGTAKEFISAENINYKDFHVDYRNNAYDINIDQEVYHGTTIPIQSNSSYSGELNGELQFRFNKNGTKMLSQAVVNREAFQDVLNVTVYSHEPPSIPKDSVTFAGTTYQIGDNFVDDVYVISGGPKEAGTQRITTTLLGKAPALPVVKENNKVLDWNPGGNSVRVFIPRGRVQAGRGPVEPGRESPTGVQNNVNGPQAPSGSYFEIRDRNRQLVYTGSGLGNHIIDFPILNPLNKPYGYYTYDISYHSGSTPFHGESIRFFIEEPVNIVQQEVVGESQELVTKGDKVYFNIPPVHKVFDPNLPLPDGIYQGMWELHDHRGNVLSSNFISNSNYEPWIYHADIVNKAGEYPFELVYKRYLPSGSYVEAARIDFLIKSTEPFSFQHEVVVEERERINKTINGQVQEVWGPSYIEKKRSTIVTTSAQIPPNTSVLLNDGSQYKVGENNPATVYFPETEGHFENLPLQRVSYTYLRKVNPTKEKNWNDSMGMHKYILNVKERIRDRVQFSQPIEVSVYQPQIRYTEFANINTDYSADYRWVKKPVTPLQKTVHNLHSEKLFHSSPNLSEGDVLTLFTTSPAGPVGPKVPDRGPATGGGDGGGDGSGGGGNTPSPHEYTIGITGNILVTAILTGEIKTEMVNGQLQKYYAYIIKIDKFVEGVPDYHKAVQYTLLPGLVSSSVPQAPDSSLLETLTDSRGSYSRYRHFNYPSPDIDSFTYSADVSDGYLPTPDHIEQVTLLAGDHLGISSGEEIISYTDRGLPLHRKTVVDSQFLPSYQTQRTVTNGVSNWENHGAIFNVLNGEDVNRYSVPVNYQLQNYRINVNEPIAPNSPYQFVAEGTDDGMPVLLNGNLTVRWIAVGAGADRSVARTMGSASYKNHANDVIISDIPLHGGMNESVRINGTSYRLGDNKSGEVYTPGDSIFAATERVTVQADGMVTPDLKATYGTASLTAHWNRTTLQMQIPAVNGVHTSPTYRVLDSRGNIVSSGTGYGGNLTDIVGLHPDSIVMGDHHFAVEYYGYRSNDPGRPGPAGAAGPAPEKFKFYTRAINLHVSSATKPQLNAVSNNEVLNAEWSGDRLLLDIPIESSKWYVGAFNFIVYNSRGVEVARGSGMGGQSVYINGVDARTIGNGDHQYTVKYYGYEPNDSNLPGPVGEPQGSAGPSVPRIKVLIASRAIDLSVTTGAIYKYKVTVENRARRTVNIAGQSHEVFLNNYQTTTTGIIYTHSSIVPKMGDAVKINNRFYQVGETKYADVYSNINKHALRQQHQQKVTLKLLYTSGTGNKLRYHYRASVDERVPVTWNVNLPTTNYQSQIQYTKFAEEAYQVPDKIAYTISTFDEQYYTETYNKYLNRYALHYADDIYTKEIIREKIVPDGYDEIEVSYNNGVYLGNINNNRPEEYQYIVQYNINGETHEFKGSYDTVFSNWNIHSDRASVNDQKQKLVTEIYYDRLGNVTQRREAAGTAQARLTRYEYDEAARQVTTVLPNNRGESLTIYNNAGDAIANKDFEGNYSYKVYDLQHRVLYEIDKENYVTAYDYDVFGNQTRITRYANRINTNGHWPGTEWSASAVANALTLSTKDRTMETSYDQLNRRIQVTQDEVDVLDVNSKNATDMKLLDVVQASPTTRYEYNAYGETVKQSVLNVPHSVSRPPSVSASSGSTVGWSGKKLRLGILGRSMSKDEARYYNPLYKVIDTSTNKVVASGHGWNRKTVTIFSGDPTAYGFGKHYYRVDYIGKPKGKPTDPWGPAANSGAAGPQIPTKPKVLKSHSITITVSNDAENSIDTYMYYNDRGMLIATVDPAGYVSTMAYDEAGRNIRTVEYAEKVSLNYIASMTYGQLYSALNHSYSNNRVKETVYDRLGQVISKSVNGKKQEHNEYDVVGNVVKTSDAANNETFIYYDALGRTTAILSPGRKLSATGSKQRSVNEFSHDAFGNVVSSIRRAKAYTAMPNANIKPIVQAHKDDQIETSYFDGLGHKVGFINAGGVFYQRTYDLYGQLLSDSYDMEVGDRKVTARKSYSYDKNGHQISERENYITTNGYNSALIKYTYYNAFGEVEAKGVHGSSVKKEFFEYDKAGRMVSTNQGDGVYKGYTYSLAGHQTAQLIGKSANYSTKYSSIDSIIDRFNDNPDGRTGSLRISLNVNDALGRTVEQHAPKFRDANNILLKPKISFSYDRWGNQISSRAGHTTAVQRQYYDAFDRRIREDRIGVEIVNAAGQGRGQANKTATTRFNYDSLGNLIRVTDANNQATTYVYNSAGQLLREKDASGAVRSSSYDLLGRVISNAANSVVTHYKYDKNNQVIEQKRGDRITRYRYDANGNRTHEIIEMGNQADLITQQIYNQRGDLLEIRLPMYNKNHTVTNLQKELLRYQGGPNKYHVLYSKKFFYDRMGNKTKMIDGNGRQMTWGYLDGGYFSKINTSTDLGGVTTKHKYHSYTGELWKQTRELGINNKKAEKEYSYYHNGLLKQIKSGSYITEVYSGGASSGNNSTDPVKNPAGPVGGSGNISSGNIGLAGPAPETNPITGSITVITNYNYDVHGNRTHEKVEHERHYSNSSTRTTIQNMSVNYDKLNRISKVSDTRDSKVIHLNYYYDAVGNRRAIIGSGAKSFANWYTYDEANRVMVSQGALSNGVIDITKNQGRRFYYYSSGVLNYVAAKSEGTLDVSGATGPLSQNSANSAANGAAGPSTPTPKPDQTIEFYNYNSAGDISRIYRYTRLNNKITKAESTSKVYDMAGRVISETVRNEKVYKTKKQHTIEYNKNSWLIRDYAKNFKAVGAESNNETTLEYSGNPAYGYDGEGNIYGYKYTNNDFDDNNQDYGIIYTNRYSYYSSYVESSRHAKPVNTDKLLGGTSRSQYDAWGNKISWEDQKTDNSKGTQSYYLNANGQILKRTSTVSSSPTMYYYYAAGQSLGSANSDFSEINFDNQYSPLANIPNTPKVHVVTEGDTLQRIAGMLYGDTTLWYLIADANGVNGNDELQAGLTLRIPDAKGLVHNSSGVFKPYSPGQILADTSPTLPNVPPPPPKDDGCGILGTILIVIVSVVATVLTSGVAAGFIGGALGSVGSAVAAGAIAGAAGNLAGQLTGMALNPNQEFSWDSFGKSALTGGITAGLGSGLSSAMDKFGNTYVGGILKSAANNAMGQAVNNWVYKEKGFSWGSIAASSVAAGTFKQLGLYGESDVAELVDGSGGLGSMQWGKVAGYTLRRFVGGVIKQSITTYIDNKGHVEIDYASVAANAFGEAIGNSLTEALFPSPSTKNYHAQKRAEQQAKTQMQFNKLEKETEALRKETDSLLEKIREKEIAAMNKKMMEDSRTAVKKLLEETKEKLPTLSEILDKDRDEAQVRVEKKADLLTENEVTASKSGMFKSNRSRQMLKMLYERNVTLPNDLTENQLWEIAEGYLKNKNQEIINARKLNNQRTKFTLYAGEPKSVEIGLGLGVDFDKLSIGYEYSWSFDDEGNYVHSGGLYGSGNVNLTKNLLSNGLKGAYDVISDWTPSFFVEGTMLGSNSATAFDIGTGWSMTNDYTLNFPTSSRGLGPYIAFNDGYAFSDAPWNSDIAHKIQGTTFGLTIGPKTEKGNFGIGVGSTMEYSAGKNSGDFVKWRTDFEYNQSESNKVIYNFLSNIYSTGATMMNIMANSWNRGLMHGGAPLKPFDLTNRGAVGKPAINKKK